VTHPRRGWHRDHEPHLLFGPDEHEIDAPADEPGGGGVRVEARPTRSQRHHDPRALWRRRGRLIIALAAVLAVVIVGVVAVNVYDRFAVKDYAGTGTSPVKVIVNSGDTAAVIGQTLQKAGVVASVQAFTKAAQADTNSQGIQPGTYTLREHMSGKNALAMLLDPAARLASGDVLVTEGATTIDIAIRIAAALNQPVAKVRAAMADVGTIGLPSTYTVHGGAPKSVEGFLYPAKYAADPGSTVDDMLTQMINKFIEQDRASGFASDAAAVKITPYQALIIASIAQSEAKFPEDMAKVARVILNRIAADQPLQIDATSAYAAKLQGLDPAKVIYSTIDSPYNTYLHAGVPPTPISNPGADAMTAATHPAAGDWLYYVNKDAAGHLFFTNSDAEFETAVAKCRANKWGCG